MISCDRFNELLKALDEARDELRQGGYEMPAQLLAMASLQMRLQFHAITDSEFKEFCRLIDGPSSRPDSKNDGGSEDSNVFKIKAFRRRKP